MANYARHHHEVGGSYNNREVFAEDIQAVKLDVTLKGQLESALRAFRPDIIVNTVALTDVDACESDRVSADALNVQSARDAAACARELRAKFIHISTDQLFDGSRPGLTEDVVPCALNEYGRTKGLGEAAVQKEDSGALILRTNFYGWGTQARGSFSDWVLRGLEKSKELTMFSDVFYTPILINNLVDVALELADCGASGVFNIVGRDRLSKYEFGLQVAKTFGYTTHRIRPISVNEMEFKAKRPNDMSLDCTKVEHCLGRSMASVIEGLGQLKELGKSGWQEELERMLLPTGSIG